MNVKLLAALAVAAVSTAPAAVVYSNLNTSSTASDGSGFRLFAQRFTTVSAGPGFQLDLNIVSLSGTQTYAVELWSADGTGNNLDSLLAAIGSGSVSSNDNTAVTTINSSYALSAATNYFIRLQASSGSFGFVLGPDSGTTLGSLTRYGVSNLNNQTTASALAMRVDVAQATAVPDAPSPLITVLGAGLGAAALFSRRRRPPVL